MNTTTAATPDQLFGYDVIDNGGNKVGSVDNVWVDDATSDLEFVGVKTGWLMGKIHVIPTETAQIDNGNQTITVPYPTDQIKDAPSFSGDDELSPDDENQIYSYYGMDRSTAMSPTGMAAGTGTTADYSSGTNTDYSRGVVDADSTTYAADSTAYAAGDTTAYATGDTANAYTTDTDTINVPIVEEELQVGKRQVQTGGVRLRKIVRTEQVQQPVELRREEVDIERIDVGDGVTDIPDNAFQEQEIDVPVMREEAVVAKQARVVGQVQVSKDVETETQTVGDTIRREDVEVIEDDDIVTDRNVGNTGYTSNVDDTDTTTRRY